MSNTTLIIGDESSHIALTIQDALDHLNRDAKILLVTDNYGAKREIMLAHSDKPKSILIYPKGQVVLTQTFTTGKAEIERKIYLVGEKTNGESPVQSIEIKRGHFHGENLMQELELNGPLKYCVYKSLNNIFMFDFFLADEKVLYVRTKRDNFLLACGSGSFLLADNELTTDVKAAGRILITAKKGAGLTIDTGGDIHAIPDMVVHSMHSGSEGSTDGVLIM